MELLQKERYNLKCNITNYCEKFLVNKIYGSGIIVKKNLTELWTFVINIQFHPIRFKHRSVCGQAKLV